MTNNNSFNDYPKILKIEDDGKIIALDKYGNVNTDLNIHTVNDQQQQDIYGKILYNPYRRTVKTVNLIMTISTMITSRKQATISEIVNESCSY